MTNGYMNAEILGRNRGIKFGMPAVQGITFDAKRIGAVLGNEIDIALVPVILYWGLFNNCYIKREDPDFTFEDVANWVDDHITDTDLFADIVKCFYESKVVAGNMEKVTEEQEKKNLT